MRFIFSGNNSHFVQTFWALKGVDFIHELNKFSPFFTARLFRGRWYIRDSAVSLRFSLGFCLNDIPEGVNFEFSFAAASDSKTS